MKKYGSELGSINGLSYEDLLEKYTLALKTIKELTSENKNLRLKANEDPLTGLKNRQTLISDFGLFKGKKLSALILDVDNFKKLNDENGHIIGDKILRKIGSILHEFRYESLTIDDVYRFGGDEFLIILKDELLNKEKEIGQKLLDIINKEYLLYNNNKIYFKISIGATTKIINESVENFISRADKALYVSKENGKNQMTIL